MNWKATFADDRDCPGRLAALAIELDRDALTLGGFVIGSPAAFDEPRAVALLAAAYGEAVSASALGYVRRAIGKQREGETPLALTCLALAGLPPLADSVAARDRLLKADGLMKSGVAPATIIEALAPSLAVQRAYNPDQPRVPAGNGEISGQWTKEGQGGYSRRPLARPIPPRRSLRPRKTLISTSAGGSGGVSSSILSWPTRSKRADTGASQN